MKFKTSLAAAIAVSGLTFALNAFGASTSFLPPAHTQGEVTYLGGGVGLNEAKAVMHAAKAHPLELEFVLKAKPVDEYLANVKVKIKNAHDKTMLDATAEGPFLLAKLPAGRYTVIANRDGKVEHRLVDIAANAHRHVVFAWRS
jgi:hypothetical protein